MPKISLIVPSYNSEEYVRACAESILNQTFKDFELIVVDDGALDNSGKMWDEIASNDKRVRVIHKRNEGQAVARNLAIGKSHGEYIMFVDSDDTIDVHMLEKMFKTLKVEKADLVWCDLYRVDDGVKSVITPIVDFVTDEKKDYILNNAGPVAKLIKKDIIVKNNLFFLENHIYEDIAVVPSYGLFAKKIVHIKEPMYDYIIYKGSTMNKIQYSEKLNDIFNAMDQIKKRFNGNYQQEIEYLYIYHLLHAASLRFLPFPEGRKSLQKIVDIMKENYPNWRKNEYYKKRKIKFKIVCNLIYNQNYRLLKLILK